MAVQVHDMGLAAGVADRKGDGTSALDGKERRSGRVQRPGVREHQLGLERVPEIDVRRQRIGRQWEWLRSTPDASSTTALVNQPRDRLLLSRTSQRAGEKRRHCPGITHCIDEKID